MRVKIRVEHKGRFISVPVSIRQLRDVYDALYMPDENWHRTLKLNKADKETYDFHRKLEWIVHDVIDAGVVYGYKRPKHHVIIKGKRAKIIDRKGKYERLRGKSYLVKTPRWRKIG